MLHPTMRSTPPVLNRVEVPGVRWVEPRFVCEVAYREYVAGGWLRHTSFKGLGGVGLLARVRVPGCA